MCPCRISRPSVQPSVTHLQMPINDIGTMLLAHWQQWKMIQFGKHLTLLSQKHWKLMSIG